MRNHRSSPAHARINLAAAVARVARAMALIEGVDPVRARAIAHDAANLARAGSSPSRAISFAVEIGGAWLAVPHDINGDPLQ